MCGIAGILRVYPAGQAPPPRFESIPEAWLDVLDDAIRHRGPDGQGRFRDRATGPDGRTVDVALVHRRLSILDHAGGAQPMLVDDGAAAVVFNGCIYNHRSLRASLQQRGVRFRTDHSDTEVIPHAWRAWGLEALDRMEGMFAAAVWERDRADVTLLRDRFGEKPLYVLRIERDGSTTVAWCSTCAGLVRLHKTLTGVHARTQRVTAWVRYGWNTAPPFESIHEVPIGSAMRCADGSSQHLIDPESRFSPWTAALRPGTRCVSAEEVDATLRRAVHARLEADVPLGCFLSGGIDSALITRYASEIRADVTAYTVRMPDSAFDESQAAAATARALGVRHEVLDCDASRAAEDLISGIEQLGLPFGDSSLLPTTWVSRAARGRVGVALSGDGGDEVFLGYERHAAARWLHIAAHLNQSMLSDLARVLESRGPGRLATKGARFLRAAAGGGYKDLLAIFPREMAERLLPGENPHCWNGHFGAVPWRGIGFREAFMVARRFDLLFALPADMLRKTDAGSMACALEVRAPMLDSGVAALGLEASRRSLMPAGRRKGLLREVAARYVPREIVDRPKMGFAIPIGAWFREDFGGLGTLLRDSLRSGEAFPPEIIGAEIDRAYVDDLVREHMDGRRDHGQRLYMLLVLAVWCRWVRRV
jgi:asparagine synthase (glutamine-hydrolysing)